MLNKLYSTLGGTDSVSVVIISVAIMLFAGFLMTRLTKLLKLPNVTAYIVAGILIGPFCLDLIPEVIVRGTEFVSDIALAFIAFGVGEFFTFSSMKRNGVKVVVITLFEALTASVAVFVLTFFVLRLGLVFSVVLAALASATAPASTLMTIRQTKSKGDFVETLLSVVALDDVVSLVAFSVAVSIGIANISGEFSAGNILKPIGMNIIMLALGAAFGFILKFLMMKRSNDNRLIVSLALLFTLCGIGAALGVSPLLGCMALGTVYANATKDSKLFKQLNYFSPPILLLFFVRSGLCFRLDTLVDMDSAIGGVPVLVIGILYFIVRIIGKYSGAFLGCVVANKPKEVRNFLGLALTPQAGVSIGLAALAARMIGGDTGSILQTIILSSSILYELIGPAMAKLALYLSKSYDPSAAEEEKYKKTDEVAALKEKLAQLQAELDNRAYARTEEESAFIDASAEHDRHA